MWFASILLLALATEPLEWRFTSGDTYAVTLTKTKRTSIDAGTAGEMTIDMQETFDLTWTVDEVADDGVATIRQKVDRIRLKMTPSSGTGYDYDSAQADSPQGLAAMLSRLLNAFRQHPIELTVTPQGEVSRVELHEEILEALKAGPGGEELGQLASAEGLKQTFALSLPPLPRHELQEGETWNERLTLASSLVGLQTVEALYQYLGPTEVGGETYHKIVTTIETRVEPSDEASVAMTLDEQKGTGEVLFDGTAGYLRSSRLDQTWSGDLQVGEEEAQGRVEQTVELKIEKQ